MKSIHEKQSALLGRKEYTFEIEHAGQATPKRSELKEQIAKKLGVDAAKLNIKHVYTNYGSNVSTVIVNVYEDETLMKLLEIPKGKKAKPAPAQ